MSKKLVVIFSGYNQRAVVAFLRTLEKHSLDYVVIAVGDDDPIFQTSYSERVIATRSERALDLVDIERCLVVVREQFKEKDSYLIAPSTEAFNRFLLEYRYELEGLGFEIPLVDKELYETISDKYRFGVLCTDYNIAAPREYKAQQVKIPCVAKPKKYYTDKGASPSPVIITNLGQLKQFYLEYDRDDFYFQEYIEGESFYLLYYFYNDGRIVKFSQRNIVQQPEGKSVIAAQSDNLHTQGEVTSYEEMFRAIGYRGLVMVETKKRHDDYFMIEANPRFWGPSQLFVDAGVNLFEDFLLDYGVIEGSVRHGNAPKDVIRYFWEAGYVIPLRSGKELTYYGTSPEDFRRQLATWQAADVYNRPDTQLYYEREVSMTPQERLIELYSQESKHSNYQVLPARLQKIIPSNSVTIKSRAEQARLQYILDNVTVRNKNVLDIGANTGFFAFSLLDAGAKMVDCYEGNKEHSDFLELGAHLTGFEDQLAVINKYFSFQGPFDQTYDVILLLNVLHHVGDDYGQATDPMKAKETILKQLNNLAALGRVVVFQLGFNWQGDPKQPLFAKGTKREVIDFIREGTKNHWHIETISIAERKKENVHYEDLNATNIERDDSLGEFLNRPLFILRSRGG